jgi:nucleolar GTP-binding protein
MRVPNVSPADDIITSGVKRAGRVTPTKGLRDPTLKERNRSAKQLDALTTALCKPLGEYVKGFPRVERLHPFERALLELTLKDDKYEATLRRVDVARKAMLSIGKQHAARAAKARGPKDAVGVREAGFEEMEAYFKRNAKQPVDELKEIAKTLRRLPVAELETPTVALVGAPNVGKSSLVRVLSSGTPEVCNYPFTTRGIKMGHFFLEEKRHIVTDTPGLLWRPDEDRNKIEKLAIATLEHLPTCVVFVFDLSGLCGTSVSDQLAIREDLHARFAHRRPWLDVMSKSELVPQLGGALCPDLEGLWGAEDEAEAEKTAAFLMSEGALSVSAEEEVGLEELREVIRTTLVKHRATLENFDQVVGFQPGM